MTAQDDLDEEKPLDPAVERVRRKMIRLMVISIGIMMIGLMAVLGAIVYKIADGGDKDRAGNGSRLEASGGQVPSGFEGRIDLAEGAEILSASLDGGNILLRVRMAGAGERLLIYSLSEDRIIATVEID